MHKVKVRRQFDHVVCNAVVEGESRTKQSFRDECDINNVMKKWEKTGLITSVNRISAQYIDLSDTPTYQEAQNVVLAADTMFNALPAQLRGRFRNNPAEFLSFMDDGRNTQEIADLGLGTLREAKKGAIAPIAGQTSVPGSGLPPVEPKKKKTPI